MKILLYIIAFLLVVIWIIVYQPVGFVHLLLLLAALVIIGTIVFDKKLTKK